MEGPRPPSAAPDLMPRSHRTLPVVVLLLAGLVASGTGAAGAAPRGGSTDPAVRIGALSSVVATNDAAAAAADRDVATLTTRLVALQRAEAAARTRTDELSLAETAARTQIGRAHV